MILSTEKLACGYGRKKVVEGIDISVAPGDMVCLLGPNGAGKTTLFRTLLGLQAPLAGKVLLDGLDLAAWPARERARRLGYVPQAHMPPFPFRVADVVAMGRTPHLGAFSGPGRKDWIAVDKALDAVGALPFRECVYSDLSGGEQRLILIARVLAQSPTLLVLDEPMANLDYGNQIRVMRQIEALSHAGYGILMTTHTPDHALQCGTSVLAIFDRKVQACGDSESVITEPMMRRMYGEPVLIFHPRGVAKAACVPVFSSYSEKFDAVRN